ncbi:MAG: hypothetical protein B1H03_02470 [Planctomycetales bacterium 4484_113]|nr:MAG: hypothetical protein B1H03_02470 [Planctomycetales bacterium 4484_113]
MGPFFVDIDTQYDFLDPSGALYVPGADKLIPVYEALYEEIREHGLLTIGSVDAHESGDPEFREFPPHCVKGEPGQLKHAVTLLEDCRFVENSPDGMVSALGLNWRETPPDSLPRQIMFEKQGFSLFGNQHVESFLPKLAGRDAVVFGVATDYCVRAAVIGLLDRGFVTRLITDAVKPVYEDKGLAALEEMAARGASFIDSAQALQIARER